MSEDKEAKYEALRLKLEEVETWPTLYMFKFIVPADNHKIAQVEALFNTEESEVKRRSSKNGNFMSITAVEMMMSADKVIERYREAEGIEGLMSL